MKLQDLLRSLVDFLKTLVHVLKYFSRPKKCEHEKDTKADDNIYISDIVSDSVSKVDAYLQQFDEILPPLDVDGDLDLSDSDMPPLPPKLEKNMDFKID